MRMRLLSRLPARFAARLTGLWRHPDFLKLWMGQSVSLFGSMITGFALPLVAILALHAGPAQIALVAGAQAVPPLLFSLAAGVWVDRLRRRPLLIAADLGRAALLATIPLFALLGRLSLTQLLIVALLTSAFTVVFDLAYPAYLPTLLRPEQLVEGNSKLEASASVAEVAGFGLAGILVQAFSAPLAIAVDAGTFLVSALTVAWIRSPEPMMPVARQRSEPTEAGPRHASIWRELAEGLQIALGDARRRALVGVTGIFTLFGYTLETVLTLYLLHDLHLSPAIFGPIWGVGGISAFFGAVFAGRAIRRWGSGRVIVWGAFIYTGAALLLPLAGGPLWLIVLLLVAAQCTDAAHTIWTIAQTSLLQRITPARALGRLNGAMSCMQGIATLAGLALGAALGQTAGLRATLFVAAFGLLLAPIWLLFTPIGSLRDAGDKTDDGRAGDRAPIAAPSEPDRGEKPLLTLSDQWT